MSAPTPQQREFVDRETASWHISNIALQCWESDRTPLTKAHRVRIIESRGRIWHQPVCGAPVVHWEGYCELAPEGYPKCLKCQRRTDLEPIPDAFKQAFEEDSL